MPKEAAEKPSGVPALARPLRPAAKAGWDWIGRRAVPIGAVLGAACLVAAWIMARPAPSFSRQKIDFPPASKLDAAIASAQDRLKADPQDIVALVDLGTLHFQRGKDYYPDAINELEQARDLGALDARVFYCLGIMYQEVGLYPFALDEYRRFLRHYPDDREVRLLEAKLLYRQASQTRQQAVGRKDKAMLARAAGDFGQAVSEYERLRFRYPNDGLVEENLGLSLWGAGATERAVESFESLKAKGGDQARRAEFYLGEIFLEQGQAQKALDELLQCQKGPGAADFGVAPYQLDAATASSYEALKQSDLAAPLWQKVLLENPDEAQSKAAKAALRRRRRQPSSKKRRK